MKCSAMMPQRGPVAGLMLAGLALLAGLGGCRGGEPAADQSAARTPGLEESFAVQAAQLDQGPRAVAVLVPDAEQADRGAVLFASQGCADCHVLGEADLSPDLRGVTARRTLPWLMRQIMEPEWMSAHDPIAQQMIRDYGLEMVTAKVSVADTEAILQYLLRESGAEAP